MEHGPYVGTVESNKDPEKLGRVKVSVPHVFGIPDTATGGVGINDLPWAIPAGLPAGGSAQSGGVDWLPEPGDQVLVFFLDGEPEKPVWMWMMQTIDQAKAYKIYNYGVGTPVGNPTRAGLTRYGHTFEINSGSVLMSTSTGYQAVLLAGDRFLFNGQARISTPRGHLFEFDDQNNLLTLNVTGDCQQNIGGQWLSISDSVDFTTVTGDFSVTSGRNFTADVLDDVEITSGGKGSMSFGTTLNLDALGDVTAVSGAQMQLTSAALFQITAPFINIGASPVEPAVLGQRLTQLFNVFFLWCAGHTHSNGNDGSPTGPPIVSPEAEVAGLLPSIMSSTVRVQS